MKAVETRGNGAAEALANAAGERAKDYVDVGVSALNTASGKVRQIAHGANGLVHDNPWLAIGAAAGLGMLIGFLVCARRET